MTPRELDKLGPDLSAFLDGELDEPRRSEIEALLEASAEARRRLEGLRTTSDLASELPRLRAPDSVTAAMRRAAEQSGARPQRPHSGRRWLPALIKVASAAAVVVLGVTIGYQFWPPSDKSATGVAGRGSTPQVAMVEKSRQLRDADLRLESLGYGGLRREPEPETTVTRGTPAESEPAGDVVAAHPDSISDVGRDRVGDSLSKRPVDVSAAPAAAAPALALASEPIELDIQARDADQHEELLALMRSYGLWNEEVGGRAAREELGEQASRRGELGFIDRLQTDSKETVEVDFEVSAERFAQVAQNWRYIDDDLDLTGEQPAREIRRLRAGVERGAVEGVDAESEEKDERGDKAAGLATRRSGGASIAQTPVVEERMAMRKLEAAAQSTPEVPRSARVPAAGGRGIRARGDAPHFGGAVVEQPVELLRALFALPADVYYAYEAPATQAAGESVRVRLRLLPPTSQPTSSPVP